MIRQYERYVADFETTVNDDTSTQEYTDVWSVAISAVGNLNPELVEIIGSIDGFIEWCRKQTDNVLVYFHNLKFDGGFITDWLLRNETKYTIAHTGKLEDNTFRYIYNLQYMPNYSYKLGVSSQGQWYSITIKYPNHVVEIRDSLKLLPFSVEQIGLSFRTKYKKLTMEYKGDRYPNCPISDEEKKYIINDVLVMSQAMQMCLDRGMKNMTIGGCCLSEYKKMVNYGNIKALSATEWNEAFPDMKSYKIDKEVYGAENADEYIRRSYFGGWCYVVEEKAGKVYRNGQTYDVNSLYPSRMHSESGCRYPIGYPVFWSGNFIPEQAIGDDKYYFVRIACNFVLKDGFLPFVQIKNNFLYRKNEMLKTNLLYDIDKDCYCKKVEIGNEILETRVTMTMTMTEYQRFVEYYDVYDFEILDGCYFQALTGIFDEYIDKYKEQKLKSKGSEREEAKLFLNNLYGKLASSDISSFKVPLLYNDKVSFKTIEEHEKDTVYIPCGSAITGYTRDFTIRHATENYHGTDKPGFIYADTDSLHMDCEAENLVIHDKNFNAWKNEASWDTAIFTRQKTYIEHVTHENGIPVEPYYNIKCAGMGKRPKQLCKLALQYNGETLDPKLKLNKEEKRFVKKGMKLTDFKVGLTVPSNLKPKRIHGGILLIEQDYCMR